MKKVGSCAQVTRSAALGLALVLGAVGCGEDAGTGGGDGPVTLEVWSFLDPAGDDPRGQALGEIVDSFNESHDDIQVEITNVHFSELDAELIRATSTGSGPDVTDVFGPWLAQHFSAGSLQPIDDYARPWLEEVGDDFIAPMEGFEFEDEIMAMPWEVRGILTFYREDLLAAAGIPVPTTLDELQDAAVKIAQENESVAGFPVPLGEGAQGTGFMEVFIPLLWSFGGELIDDKGEAVFNSDAGVQVIEWMKQLEADGAMGQNVVTMDVDDYLQTFQSGAAAFAQIGSHRVSSARASEGIGDSLVTMAIPGVTKGDPAPTIVNSWALGIGANSEHPDEAWEFIEYRLEKEAQLTFMGAGVMSVRSSVFDDPSIDPELLEWRDYLSTHGRSPRYPADYTELSIELATAAQSMIFEDAPVAETLDDVAGWYNDEGRR